MDWSGILAGTHLGLTIVGEFVVVPLGVAQPEVIPGSTEINFFQAIVLGIVQGLTEFLPISSTAHLKVIPVAIGWGDPGVAFTAIIQLGSIAAMLWYFWKDLSTVAAGTVRAVVRREYQSTEFRIGLGILVGTLPILIGGLLIKTLIPDFDNSPLRSMKAIALASIGMSLLLALAEYVGRRKRTYNDLETRDGILMGLAQALALIPGVSRSGSTLTAGLFIGLQRAAAARFSFLLGIPAITLAGVVELKDLLEVGFGEAGPLPLLGGLVAALFSSYVAIAWLLRYLQNHNTWVFVWYRLGFGAVILLGIAAGLVQDI
ncbi:undecaprenyl-diphosphate phosphatase [Oculatella sp. LEGE 06141]|uniref:undecaprenyl-diphosphate phosphatase n=1 Tax=Oculatella sp. LEGE 06141 TaxID=1828648 RepID=UPI00188156FC|nr:undecaprenyl-diphosphate phosphatase [Oculatella sp. LEGE 06141]MBE9181231.1 undecaprenyl-diphosphate phosphatase [Oculatella sp. LEGE 06141]